MAHDNDRSYKYAYDGLNRLVDAHLGRLATDNQTIVMESGGPFSRELVWALDNLGNWSGGNDTDGSLIRRDETDGDGNWNVTERIHHAVDSFNAITSVTTKMNDGNPQTVTFVDDPNGNLVFDPSPPGYVYQYDAWNRLVEVNEAGDLTTNDFDADSKLHPNPEG